MRHLPREIEQLDATLVALASGETALRLHLGQLLELLSRGAFHALGFSSLAAYVLERCDRSVRWAEVARCLARRLERLPELRRAMASGDVSWSMGELIARVARPDDEANWLEQAKARTVRQMRVLVATALSGRPLDADTAREGTPPQDDTSIPEAATEPGWDPAATANDEDSERDDDAPCTLTCTVAQEDAWLYEATRSLLEHMGVHGSAAQSEALLAEAQDTLLAALPRGTIDLDLDGLHGWDARQQRWCTQLAYFRTEAEASCEPDVQKAASMSREHRRAAAAAQGEVASAAEKGLSALDPIGAEELDARVRTLAGALARHELELSQLILRFHRANGWRQLGYATETQYARERLGLSPSLLLARRSLALRLERLPRVAVALGAGKIGVEAALQVVRVATPNTENEWVERARRRTIKHLREEVAAARVAVRCSREADCLPPTDDEMNAFHRLEQAVVSGRASERSEADSLQPEPSCSVRNAQSPAPTPGAEAPNAEPPIVTDAPQAPPVERAPEPRRSWRVMLTSLAHWLDGTLQTSAAKEETAAMKTEPISARSRVGSSAGRVTLRLQMPRSTYVWWRLLEARAQRWLGRGISWLRFLCSGMWQTWRHLLHADVAYGRI